MCGIAGILASELPRENKNNSLKQMLLAINHRGPDDTGIWQDENYNVALGHVRLSILDFTTNGHQPMISHSNRYVLTYNGEIYNFREIKQELDKSGKGFAWKSESDTEVILAAIEAWGLDQALAVMTGMFAFVLWDNETRKLILCRDRMGEKPLYYGVIGNTFYFSSEMDSFHQLEEFKPDIDREALGLYMQYGYVPPPCSIYKRIKKIKQGSYIPKAFEN